MKHTYEILIITDKIKITSTIGTNDIEGVLNYILSVVKNNNVISFDVKLITVK